MRPILASVLLIGAMVAAGATGSGAAPFAAQSPGGTSGLIEPAHHRCVSSRCRCVAGAAQACTRDCRRDRHCWCVGGRYVCRYFH